MNIFYIDSNPAIAAKMMTDKHIVKMILESAQMLSTAHRQLDGDVHDDLYKSAYVNHPSTVWVRQSSMNYMWLYEHFVELNNQYTQRYGKVHKSFSRLNHIVCHPPKNIALAPFTPPPCCMPDVYQKYDDHIKNYRAYYLGEKLKKPKDIARYYGVIQQFNGTRRKTFYDNWQ